MVYNAMAPAGLGRCREEANGSSDPSLSTGRKIVASTGTAQQHPGTTCTHPHCDQSVRSDLCRGILSSGKAAKAEVADGWKGPGANQNVYTIAGA